MFFSLKNIPTLSGYSTLQRVEILQAAARLMPFKRRALANTLKAFVLIALFWPLIYVPGIVWKVTSLFAVVLLYPLLLMPITLNFALPFIPEARTAFDQNKQANQPQE